MSRACIGFSALVIAIMLGSLMPVHAFPAGSISVGGGTPIGTIPGGMSPVGPLTAIRIMPQRFRDLTVVGQVGVDPAKLPSSATIVRLRLDGREIPMRLDTEMHGADIQFDPHAGYSSDLYRAVLSKQVEVVGEQALRDDIAAAADQSRSMRIEGYVFDPISPYFVVKSVRTEY